MSWADLVLQARMGRGPLRYARAILKRILGIRMPVFRPLAAALWAERDLRQIVWPTLLKIVYREPLWNRALIASIALFLLDLLVRRVRLFDRKFVAKKRHA